MRELSQTFDRSANTSKGHTQGQGPAQGGLEFLWRPQIQLTGPCTALPPHAAAVAQTTTWRCVPHSPGVLHTWRPSPDPVIPRTPRVRSPSCTLTIPGLDWAAEGSRAWPPHQRSADGPRGQTLFTCHLEMQPQSGGREGAGPLLGPLCSSANDCTSPNLSFNGGSRSSQDVRRGWPGTF